MIDPAFIVIVASAAVATSIAVSVACVTTASRMGMAVNVLLDIADMMERDRKRLLRIRKLRQIMASQNGQHRANGSMPPAIYTPRYDQGGRQ